jgi:hypothetical protein
MATNDDQGGCHDFTIFCNDKRFVVIACPGPAPDHPITLLLSRDSAATLAATTTRCKRSRMKSKI